MAGKRTRPKHILSEIFWGGLLGRHWVASLAPKTPQNRSVRNEFSYIGGLCHDRGSQPNDVKLLVRPSERGDDADHSGGMGSFD